MKSNSAPPGQPLRPIGRYEIAPDRIFDGTVYPRTPLDRQTERGERTQSKPRLEPKAVKGSTDTAFHARNFLECLKSRAKCNLGLSITTPASSSRQTPSA